MRKGNHILLWAGTSGLFIALALTSRLSLLGAVAGYWSGFINTGWLWRDTQRSVDLDVLAALGRMRRSFFARLGLITLVTVAIARFQPEWLLEFAIGILAGLVISFVSFVRQQLMSERGD